MMLPTEDEIRSALAEKFIGAVLAAPFGELVSTVAKMVGVAHTEGVKLGRETERAQIALPLDEPALFSDWIRACELSPFGAPTDSDPTLATVKLGWRSRRVWVRFLRAAALVTTGHNITGPVYAECRTPAELRAALERLAAEKP